MNDCRPIGVGEVIEGCAGAGAAGLALSAADSEAVVNKSRNKIITEANSEKEGSESEAGPKQDFESLRMVGSLNRMMTLATLARKRGEILSLAEQYRTGDVRVFGSVARGENTEASDVDLLVNTRPGCSLFDLGGLLEDLQTLLGCRVDLVTEDGLKPRLRARVLREAVPL